MGEIVQHHDVAAIAVIEPDEHALQRMIRNIEVVRRLVENTFAEGVDYGKIPGTVKPVLFQPGAQKTATCFRLMPRPTFREDALGDDHLEVVCTIDVVHQVTGAVVGYGIGSASTMESKHRYRSAQPTCPECGKDAIRRDTKGDRGWYCWAKVGGCGIQFGPDDQRLAQWQAGKVENPDIADVRNTVRKMAYKRAMVHAVINTTGCGNVFDQDIAKDAEDRRFRGESDQWKPTNRPPMPTAASARPERPVDASDYGGAPDMQPREQVASAQPPAGAPSGRPAGDDYRDTPISEPQAKRMFALEKKHGVTHEAVKQYMREHFGAETSNQLHRRNYDEVCAWIESRQASPPK